MVAVFVVDRLQRCRFINAVAEHLTRVPLSEAVGRPFADLVWGQTPYAFAESHLGRALGSAHAEEGEELLVDGDGARRAIAFRMVPIALDPAEGKVIEIFDLGGETGGARALRESEQRLRLAAEATGIGIWDVNAVTGRRRWSAEFKTILGLQPDAEPSSDLFISLVHPDDRGWLDELYRRKYASPDDPNYTAAFRILRANDGAERWVSTTGRITFDATGLPLRGVGTLRDINDARRSELALRESEERLRVALVAGRMGLWRHEFATGRQEWDATQYQILGLDPSVSASRERFLALVEPEDLRAIALDPAALPAPGTFLDSEFRIKRPDGKTRWLAAHGLVRNDKDGKPFEMIGVNRDMTEQKEAELALQLSEERHRLAVEANDIGTWDFDMVTGEHRWSPEFKAIWGLPQGSKDDPNLLRPLIDDDALTRAQHLWTKATDIRDGTGRIAVECEIRRADTGERRWCSFAGHIFFDPHRTRPIRALGIAMDTTARRAREDGQRRVLRELHHRVNNNLAIIQAILSQTLRSPAKPREAFERIQSRLMCLARVHEILSHSEWGEISLTRLLTSELVFAEGTRDRVSLNGEPVLLDSNSAITLGLVFHELAINAAKYGAMSIPDGRVDVGWSLAIEPRRQLDIIWSERGPPARPPRREGFGFRVIRGSVAGNAEAKGQAEVDFTPEGVRWRIGFPIHAQIGEHAQFH